MESQESQEIQIARLSVNFSILLFSFCTLLPYVTNHMIYFSLFGKQESLESCQESWNQAKIPKDSESRQTKSTVSDPLDHYQKTHIQQVQSILLVFDIKGEEPQEGLSNLGHK